MKKIIFFIVACQVSFAFSQNNIKAQQEIDTQVWKVFKKAFESLDAEALNDTYAAQVIRVTPQGIDTKNNFKGANLESFRASKDNGTKINLDFWFDSRHTNADTSYEVGFYRIRFSTDTTESIVYGQFHIVLKKINGLWKITQDWDTTIINGKEITSKDFNKKKPLKF